LEVKYKYAIVAIVVIAAIAAAVFGYYHFAAPAPPAPGAPPIVFGVATDLGTIEGADSLRSVQMAIEEINAKGGVLVGGQRRLIKLVSIDTREAHPGVPVHDALAAMEKLILEEKPHIIISGPFRSEVLLAAMDLWAKYKLVSIVNIAMTPIFQEKILKNYDVYKYGFRTCLNSPGLAMYLTELMKFVKKEFGFNKAYFVVQDVLWARATGEGMREAIEKEGWEVVGFDAYPTGATEFSPSLMKAKDAGAQVIVPIFDMPESGILLKQARAMKIPALMVGFISPVAPENAWEVFKGEVEGMVNVVFEAGPIPVKAIPKSVEFNKKFGERWGEDRRKALSGHGPGPSYDAVYMVVAAIERAGSLEPDAIIAELEKTDMKGVIGRIRFGKDHQVIYGLDPEETAIGVAFQWVGGKRVVVFPEAVAEGKIQLPPYMGRAG
jgi:branched-chain amino acid transport system substrate-binding protein